MELLTTVLRYVTGNVYMWVIRCVDPYRYAELLAQRMEYINKILAVSTLIRRKHDEGYVVYADGSAMLACYIAYHYPGEFSTYPTVYSIKSLWDEIKYIDFVAHRGDTYETFCIVK